MDSLEWDLCRPLAVSLKWDWCRSLGVSLEWDRCRSRVEPLDSLECDLYASRDESLDSLERDLCLCLLDLSSKRYFEAWSEWSNVGEGGAREQS